MLNDFIGFIEELVFETGISFLKSVNEKRKFRKILNEYVESQIEINNLCLLDEELDFESLYEYILCNLLSDIKIYLFDINIDKNKMKEYILIKTQDISNAYGKAQCSKVDNIILQAINVIENFYKQQINYNEWFLAANLVSEIIEETKKQNERLLNDIRGFITSYNKQSKADNIINIYSNLDKIFQSLYGDKKIENIEMRHLRESYYDEETGKEIWTGVHFKVTKPEKDDIIQTFLVDVVYNPFTEKNIYHFVLLDKMEESNGEKNEITFFVDNPSISIDFLILICIRKQKSSIVQYLLKLDNETNEITYHGHPKAITINDKMKETGDFLAHFFKCEPINEIEYNYSISIEQEYIIIDIETGEVINPIAYYDTLTRNFKGKIYLSPTKYYFCFTIWSSLDLKKIENEP